VKPRSVFKSAIGVLAIVVLIGVGAAVWFIVAAFMSLEKSEQHRREFQAELDSGKWDFGDQPALFAVAQGIVKNNPEAIRTAAIHTAARRTPGGECRNGITRRRIARRTTKSMSA
jgi:hypothetical protein